jgi:hypothetical protein
VAEIDRERLVRDIWMNDLTPELRDEIARHLREMSSREGMIIRDMERGLTVEQIAASQRTSVDNARNYARGTEAMLRGELPTAPSMALKASGGYRYLLWGCDLSPALRSYVTSCLRQLATINPEIRVEEPYRPGTLRDARTQSGLGLPDNIANLRWQVQDGFARNQVGGKPQIAKWTGNAGHDHQLAILRDDDGTPVAKWTTKDAAWRVVHMIDGNATDLVTGVTFGIAYRRSVDHYQAVMAAQADQATALAPPAGYFILNQREVRADDDGYNDVEGQSYHWTSQSSGAWKRLSVSPGAHFVYYRPGTASDGTAQSYFGVGAIGQVSEQAPGDFVATIGRPVPSPEGPSVNHQTSILPIAKGDFDKLVRLGDARTQPGRAQKVWIFQANPQLFDLLDFLTEPSTQPGTVNSWLLRRHADDVSDGDTVLLWTAGENAGIYATGTIVGESFLSARGKLTGLQVGHRRIVAADARHPATPTRA